ncbi:phytoene desaturase [Chitinophaga rupis]|uniref:Phytoene desaturase n=1 Tax=Chitinophaga rupis TaxID=573321 RepID=A0A1H7V351_9BACT|nr:phytoene desaturase family protein [Chitinophaga rupis]SEM03479.1 phytoene desaturase [Chitinophaga rupis]
MGKSAHSKSAIVIGSGFAGLSGAICLAAEGYDVTIIEKNSQTGGRARMLEASGFRFDMGPSWYWMPEVIQQFFKRFGRSLDDYFHLQRLDPSYQVIFSGEDALSVPADYEALKKLFESIEPGSGTQLDAFLREARYKYESGMQHFAYKPGQSLTEFIDPKVFRSLFRMDMLTSFSKHVRKYFSHPRLLQILEFPVLFLGAEPAKIPALYSMMNYADMRLGTWYPQGGMHCLVTALTSLAQEMGVDLLLDTEVFKLNVQNKKVKHVHTTRGCFSADIIIAAADYHHVDRCLLSPQHSSYSDHYWETRKMAPSCLLYYVGVNKKLPRLQHHNLFFESDFSEHAACIYNTRSWPEDPLFYLCCPSKTDRTVAPPGMENLFFLIPTAPGLPDNATIRNHYFDMLIKRTADFCGEDLSSNIVFRQSYAHNNFVEDYHAFKGNAYGLANTLKQTAVLKPSIRSKRVNNLFFAGQLTVPGPGVPPAIISGQVTAGYIIKHYNKRVYESVI